MASTRDPLERGLASAIQLCDEYNLTLDWLYRDDLSGLPADLWLKIRAASKAK